ncbi:hypothetical protein BZA77DRAFT_277486 [Pyronema omphalodes]|nr:hypothetical protein BZA77DRAFT_277486 [Pyronema omphalodes]
MATVPPKTQTPHTKASSTPLPMLPEFALTDNIVLVTGGARGLGLTQSSALISAGATVYVLDRLRDPDPDFLKLREKVGGEVLHYRQLDVTSPDTLQDTVRSIGERHGRIDGLLAAAGINIDKPALEYSKSEVDRVFEVNATGVFLTAQAVAKEMVRYGNGGSVVLVASMSGTVANRELPCAAYNASKAAVLQMARNLAAEWGEHNIRVNTLSPGYILTPMTEHDFKRPEREKQLSSANMLGRLSTPEEYRGAALFLLSGASSFMTGADLRIDGGHSAW